MCIRRKFIVSLLLILFFVYIFSFKSYAFKVLYTCDITQDEIESIEELLSNFYEETGIDTTIYFLESLRNKDLEDYTQFLYDIYCTDEDSLFILIVVKDRKIRIQPGSELYKKLNKFICLEMVHSVKKDFRNEDYVNGIECLLDTAILGLNGELPKHIHIDIDWISDNSIYILSFILGLIYFSKFDNGTDSSTGSYGGDSSSSGSSGGSGASGGW